MSLLHVVLALLGATGAGAGSPRPPAPSVPQSATVDYGLFGPLHLSRPGGELRHTVVLFSDRDGWTPRQQGIGDALAARGAFVVGIDLPAYLARMAAIKDTNQRIAPPLRPPHLVIPRRPPGEDRLRGRLKSEAADLVDADPGQQPRR